MRSNFTLYSSIDMMNKFIITISLLSLIVLSSCDDGRIYEKEVTFKEGKVVKMTGTLTGIDSWGEGYNVALAGFDDTDKYAIISRVIHTTEEGGKINIDLSGIDEEATHIELCILNRLRQRVATVKEMPLEDTRDTIRFEIGDVDVSMLNIIQQQVFNNSCTACHGDNGRAASGLNLTAGNSYGAMVNVPSKKVEGLNIVTPGDKENSVLHLLLNTELSSSWRQNHSDMLNKERTSALLTLIDDWIDNGAKQ